LGNIYTYENKKDGAHVDVKYNQSYTFSNVTIDFSRADKKNKK